MESGRRKSMSIFESYENIHISYSDFQYNTGALKCSMGKLRNRR
jgi:hypothetical protein